jgi:hypothetical protein
MTVPTSEATARSRSSRSSPRCWARQVRRQGRSQPLPGRVPIRAARLRAGVLLERSETASYSVNSLTCNATGSYQRVDTPYARAFLDRFLT